MTWQFYFRRKCHHHILAASQDSRWPKHTVMSFSCCSSSTHTKKSNSHTATHNLDHDSLYCSIISQSLTYITRQLLYIILTWETFELYQQLLEGCKLRQKLQISLSAVTVRSHSFVMCCRMGLPLPKVSRLWIQLQKCLHWPQLQKAWKDNMWAEAERNGGGKRVKFFWMDDRRAGEPWTLSCIGLFSLQIVCIGEKRGEADRDRKENVIHL